MKKFTTVGLFFAMLLFTVVQSSAAQSNDAINMFKKHVNGVVQKVEMAETPNKKRKLLNTSFEKLLSTFNKAESMQTLSGTDQASLNKLRATITEKQNELNGHEGFKRVPDNQLNNFANFVQQDLEQADSTVTISVTVLLLIVIILLLL
jgi:hypothetical protein